MATQTDTILWRSPNGLYDIEQRSITRGCEPATTEYWLVDRCNRLWDRRHTCGGTHRYRIGDGIEHNPRVPKYVRAAITRHTTEGA
jgi:hypothetical protein